MVSYMSTYLKENKEMCVSKNDDDDDVKGIRIIRQASF